MKGGEEMKKYNVIRGYMTRSNLTQTELSKCIGISYGALSKRLTGKLPFTADEMQAIQKVLNDRLGMQLTIDELFFS